MTFEPREGDERPNIQDPPHRLTWAPAHDEPFRWLPRHGEPLCVGEYISQKLIKLVAWLPVYIAIVVTIMLLLQIYVLSRLL